MADNEQNVFATGKIVAVCVSKQTGEQKQPVEQSYLVEQYGLEGDAHGGDWHRQVSLLADESAEKMRAQGLNVQPGDFAENLTTKNIDLTSLPIGTKLYIGEKQIELTVTQIGKECHDRCAIYYQAGDCVMPKEGVFARIEQGGPVQPGDIITIVKGG